ncbi:ABC transporter [Limnohabitans sp. T6-5]|uniref:type I secretion system permease/ATPase n=1 Tax=Limnohabitans sp. T6-5 TaxID=1100724 RepID=UPI000DD26EC2|nr:type I secretion system permease/ATPase [Limnohabitans sp. T6-5]PUE10828.1 ABC transporter [Limnohabitans sp. T6-5]
MTDFQTPEAPMLDQPLAHLLSRLAGLQGQAVPVHRFGMMASTDTGLSVDALSRTERMKTWWRARFPNAEIAVQSLDDLKPEIFPLLWLSRDETQVLLVRGRSGRGALITQNEKGETLAIEAAAAGQGTLFRLTTAPAQPGDTGHHSMSATDWFAFTLRRYRFVFFEGVAATFVLSTLGLVSAMYSMQVYDRVIPSKGYATLWVLTIGVVISIILELVIKQVRAYMVDRACKLIDQELSAVFFGKALDIRLDARPGTVGTFASQIRQFESVRNFLTSSSLFIMADLPFGILFIGVIGLLAGPVAWVPIVMVPVSILAGLAFRRSMEKLTTEHMEESNLKNGLLIEAIDGIESVKAANAEWKMLTRWRAMTAHLASNELKMRMMSSLSSNVTQSLQQISYVGMVAVGAYAINAGYLTMGSLIACSIISGRALTPVAQLSSLIVQWEHARVALKSLNAIMAMPSDRDPQARLVVPEQCTGELRMDKVGFAYAKGAPSIEISSLQIRPGERIAVLGAVGSGKSTFIKLLGGLYKPMTGHLFLDGVDAMHLAPEYVRESIAYLPQDIRLFKGTLRENLSLGLPMPSDTQILRAAAMTGLDSAIQNHPKGLELEIAEGGRGLSGGQRQLVGLTRMLLACPKVLLLDEPTASMDGQLEIKVMRHLFQEMPKDAVIVVVTHKPALLPHVDRVLVMDRGRIVLDGPRDEVLARLSQNTPTPTRSAPSAVAIAPGGAKA